MKNIYVCIIILFIASLLISFGCTYCLLPLLKRLKAGQSIREEGPQSHMAKAGTPTMGGIAIIISFSLCMIFSGLFKTEQSRFFDTLLIIAITLVYGLIGFYDDYIKVIKKRNLGLTEIRKLLLQTAAAIPLAVFAGAKSTEIYIPFYRQYVDFGWLYYPFVVFVVVAMTNAVNLTDGLDGLVSSVTAVAALPFVFMGITAASNASAAFGAAALCGACMGFYILNRHPARVFMGDTGSLALGAALSGIAIVSGLEFILPLAGLIYVLEALSVLIQVFVFKTQNGRRFFRMAPLHHHFELGGMPEKRVVAIFSLITIVMASLVVLFA